MGTEPASKPSAAANLCTFVKWFLSEFRGDFVVGVPVGILWYFLHWVIPPAERCIPGATTNPAHCNFYVGNTMDVRLAFPWREDSISSGEQYSITMALWLIPIIAGCIMNRRKLTLAHGKIFVTLLVQVGMIGPILNQCFQKSVKQYVGWPRPNYYWILIHNPNQAQQSFPSGHAMMSNTILLLLFFHLCTVIQHLQYKRDGFHVASALKAGESNTTDGDGELLVSALLGDKFFEFLLSHKMDTPAYFISFIPVIIGEYIGFSRIIDYQHDVSDVLGGAMMGALCAGLLWKTYYTRIYGTLFYIYPQTAVATVASTGNNTTA